MHFPSNNQVIYSGSIALFYWLLFFHPTIDKSGDLKKKKVMIRKHGGDSLSSHRNGFLSYTLLFYIFHPYYFSQIRLALMV